MLCCIGYHECCLQFGFLAKYKQGSYPISKATLQHVSNALCYCRFMQLVDLKCMKDKQIILGVSSAGLFLRDTAGKGL